MKKFLLSFFVLFAFGVYAMYQKFAGKTGFVPLPAEPMPTDTPMPTVAPIMPSMRPSMPPTKKTQTGMYANGEYIGNNADAYYGNVQVKAVIQNGKLIDVQFLDYPHDRNTSIYINSQAMPYLKSEAIQAQSANMNIISGATATSEAFRESLASALNQAKQ